MKRSTKLLTCIAFVFAFCFLAIGYAAVQDTLLIDGSISVEAPNRIYAVYDSTLHSLTFRNGVVPDATDGETIYTLTEDGYTSENPPPWSTLPDLYTVNTEGEFSAPQSMAYWFYGCGQLEKINLSGINTSEVTDFSHMFSGCRQLQAIYVDTTFVIDDSDRATNMFKDCENLKGGNSTNFDALKIENEYAHIDGMNGESGYFSYGYYTIKFDANLGQNGPPTLFCKSNGFTVPEGPSHLWGTFAGWETMENNENKIYQPDSFYVCTSEMSVPCTKVFSATWTGLGAMSQESLNADINGDIGTTADNPLIIGGGEYGEIYNLSDHHLIIYDGQFDIGLGGRDENGNFYTTAAIYHPGASVISIKGGEFKVDYLFVFPDPGFTLHISGGTFEIKSQIILIDGVMPFYITGGTFSKDPRTYSGATIISGHRVIQNDDGTYTVVCDRSTDGKCICADTCICTAACSAEQPNTECLKCQLDPENCIHITQPPESEIPEA